MDRSKNVVIIPAYNEAATIGGVVSGLLPFANVIVVDDCSSDGTAAEAAKAGADVVKHRTNRGYEAALESGFVAAVGKDFEHLVTFDADGQHSALTALKFFEALESSRVDLVLGVRPQKARVAESIMGLYFRLRFGVDDILCGLKGYRAEVYKSVGYFDRSKTVGGEIILAALKNGASFQQLPVPITRRAGESRFGNSLRGNLKIIKALKRLVKMDAGFEQLEHEK